LTDRTPRRGISRRGFVTGALGTGVAVGAGAALAGCSSPEPATPSVPQAAFIPFEGAHQAGITTLPIPEQGLVASFNLHVRDRAGLKSTRLLDGLTDRRIGTTQIDAITLFHSKLSPKGPTYTPLLRTPLGQ